MFTLPDKEIVPYFVYLFLFVIFLVIGDSFLQLPLLCVFTLISLFDMRSWDWKKAVHHHYILSCWVLYLLVVTIATVFSHSLPLSLHELVVQYFAFVFFCSVLFTKSKLRSSEHLFPGFVLITIVMVTLSTVAQVVPAIGVHLPPMTLLYPKFGHNHLAAFLLLVLPLSAYVVVKNRNRRAWVFFAIVCVALVLSWGRVALVIGLLQLIALAFFLFQKKLVPRKVASIIFSSLSILFIACCLTIGYYTLVQFKYDTCSAGMFRKFLCKNPYEEPRLEYWRQAVVATREYPLIGYGPGTFELINKKYRSRPAVGTAFAHNTLLETLSESGIVAVLLLGILGVSLVGKSYRVVSSQATFENVALFIAVSGQLINSMFDYDLNHIGIYIITVLFFAKILSGSSFDVSKETVKSQKKYQFFIKLSLTLSVGFILFFGLLFFVTEALLLLKKPQYVAERFPYFVEQKHILLLEENIKKSNADLFLDTYENHPEVVQNVLTFNITNAEKVAYYARLHEIYPWGLIWLLQTKDYTNEGFVEALQEQLNRSKTFLVAMEKMNKVEHHEQREILANKYIELTDYFYKNGSFEKGNTAFLKAIELRPWILDETQVVFYQKNFPQTEWCQLMVHLSSFNEYYFGKNATVYVSKMTECLSYCFSTVCPVSQREFAERMLTFTSTNSELLFGSFASNQLERVAALFAAGQVEQAKALLTNVSEVITVLELEGLVIEGEVKNAIDTLTKQLDAAMLVAVP